MIDGMNDISIFIPAPGKPLPAFIAPRSAIVGLEPQGDRIAVYYEGNIYETPAMARFADRVYAAAGRLEAHYTTVARALLSVGDLAHIGYWNDEDGLVLLDGHEAARALAAYLETGHLNPEDLVGTSSSRWQIKRDMATARASSDTATRMAADWY